MNVATLARPIRPVDLEQAIEQATRAQRDFLTGFPLFRTVDPDAKAQHVRRIMQELGFDPPPFDDEPLPEHVGPVVTSFDQALYLLSKGWQPGG